MLPEEYIMALIDNIISYYKFDSDASDSLGTNNGTVTGATINSSGKIGSCYAFSGSSQYITCGTNQMSSGTNGITVSMWVYPTVSTQKMFVMLNYGGSKFSFMQSAVSSNDLLMARYGSTHAYTGTNALTLNTWNHIIFTYNGGDLSNVNNYKIYVDSVSKSLSVSGTHGGTNSTTNYIGRDADGYYYSGKIDEIGIWSRTLNSSEISSLYNSGSGLTYPFYTYAAPTITINSPSTGSSYESTTNISFTSTITKDSSLSISSISWSSDLDGTISTSEDFSYSTLSVGSHTITATVTDSESQTDTDSISLTITPHVGVFCTVNDVQYKAGSGANIIAKGDTCVNNFILQSESFINVMCRYNFSDVYNSLNTDVKGLLNNIASSLAAIYVINYDMSGYASRLEAEDKINVLRDDALRDIQLLKDKKVQDFIKGA